MTDKRMTDEEIGDIEKAIWGTEGVVVKHCQKLIQAMKADREDRNDWFHLQQTLEYRLNEYIDKVKRRDKRIRELEDASLFKSNRIEELEAEVNRLEYVDQKWEEVYDKSALGYYELQRKYEALASGCRELLESDYGTLRNELRALLDSTVKESLTPHTQNGNERT